MPPDESCATRQECAQRLARRALSCERPTTLQFTQFDEPANHRHARDSVMDSGPSFHWWFASPAIIHRVSARSVLGSWVGVRRPFRLSLFLTASDPYGFYPKILVLTALDTAIPGHPGAPRGAGGS